MRRLNLARLRVRSLRTRFGIAVAVLVLVAVCGFGTYVYINVGRGLRISLDEALRVSASLAASTVRTSGNTLDLGESVPESNAELEPLLLEGYTVRYLDGSGRLLGGFGPMLGSPIDPAALRTALNGDDLFSNTTEPKTDRDYRVYTLSLTVDRRGRRWIHPDRPMTRTRRRSSRELLAALLLGGVVVTSPVGLAAYFLARRALAPIDTITGRPGRSRHRICPPGLT